MKIWSCIAPLLSQQLYQAIQQSFFVFETYPKNPLLSFNHYAIVNSNVKKNAVISVSKKDGLETFASFLIENNYEIYGTSGTKDYLSKHNVRCENIEKVTRNPEMLEGRVKTLSSFLMAGILSKDRRNPDLETNDILPIDLVYVEPYDFIENFLDSNEDLVEFIDIGGITLLRAAAKNYERVIPIIGRANAEYVKKEMRDGKISLEGRKRLSADVFKFTSLYDYAISQWLGGNAEILTLGGKRLIDLRYGENPHQAAFSFSLYHPFFDILREGKEISYNNILDAWTAWELVTRLGAGGAVVVKHMSPCGAAIGVNSVERAHESDPVSAYGGILAYNGILTTDHAMFLKKKFLELIIANGYEKEAYDSLAQKKNLRILKGNKDIYSIPDIRTVGNVILAQEWNRKSVPQMEMRSGRITTEIQSDIKFGWEVTKSVKSNAITIVKNGWLVSSGGGQPNRVDSVKIAINKARESHRIEEGLILISDGFFPFIDSLELANGSGIKMIAAPMGSIRDDEIIKYSEENDLTFVEIKERAFRH